MSDRFLVLRPGANAHDIRDGIALGRAHFHPVPRDLAETLATVLKAYSIGAACINEIVGGSLSVALFDGNTTRVLPHPRLGLQDLRSQDPAATLRSAHPIVCTDPNEVRALGAPFFWKHILDPARVLTNNPALLDSVFFPTQLAKDGRGVFYEERLAHRVHELGIVPADGVFVRVVDLGGWQDRHHLEAAVEIVYRIGVVESSATLLGLALAPWPPFSPEMQTEYVNSLSVELRSLGIRTSILRAEEGVVYHCPTVPVGRALAEAAPIARRNLVRSCAELVGALAALPESPTTFAIPPGAIGAEIAADGYNPRKRLIDFLGVIDGVPCWAGTTCCPWLVISAYSAEASLWDQFGALLTVDEKRDAFEVYSASRQLVSRKPQ